MFEDGTLRRILGSILRGHTKSTYHGKTIYFKHLSMLDIAEIGSYEADFFERAVKEQIPTEKEKLEILFNLGAWSIHKENEIDVSQKEMDMRKTTRAKLVLPSQKRAIDFEIKEWEEKLLKLKMDRARVMGDTAEDFSRKRNNEYYVYRSSFKDGECTDLFFTEEEWDELEEKDVEELTKIYNTSMAPYFHVNIQKIAFSHYFQNTFRTYHENPYYFFGKWVKDLSYYQAELYAEGCRLINILTSDNVPPDDVIGDPEKLIEWFESSRNAKELLEKTEGNVALAGATREDLKELGLNDGIEHKSLAQKLREKFPGRRGGFSIDEVKSVQGIE